MDLDLNTDLHDDLGESLKLDLPEALPLYSPHKKINSQEPEIKYKINRLMKKPKKGDKDGEDEQENKIEEFKKPLFCKHTKVIDHVCEDCREKIISSGNLFDTGNVGIYINIKYVNEFLEQNEDQEIDLKKFTPVIYENYKPKNSHDMREYMLFVLDKSLKKLQKYETQVPSICAQFGLIGAPMTWSEDLKTYLCVKRTRELQVLGVEKNPEQDSEMKIGPNCLLFDSNFESGNLERAEYVKQTEYNLYLNVDTNTKGHQQWFYFKVKNTRKGKRYVFNIKNFTKPFSLHRQGMQIMMKSKKQGNKDWIPSGYNISYSKSDAQRSGWRIPGPINLDDEEDDDQILDDIHGVDGMSLADHNKKGKQRHSIVNNLAQVANIGAKKRKRYFYCLSFELEFDHDNDNVYLAYSTPYQYSSIFYHMLQLEQNLIDTHQKEADFKFTENFTQVERIIQTNEIYYERKLLCKTVSGLPVPYVTVTSRRNKGEDFKKRKAICITSRVHPGETNSNFVFDGFFENLLDYSTSYQLLNNYIFKLIPCLNPDGVICGNYRSSLAGVDLNRQWILPSKELHPTIYYTKDLLSQTAKERQLLVFCDLHCHSKKKNSFIYGCNTAANGGFTSWTKVRLLPRILAKLTALFSIKDCRFRIDPSKLGTARVIVWKEFGVTNSFTLENSFYGFQIAKKVERFIPEMYKEIGENLLRSMNEYRILSKQIEKEVALTNGWLKPKLLLEITGTPAAEKIAKELQQKQKEQRRRKLIEEYKLNMGLIDEAQQEFKSNIKFNLSKVEGKSRNLYIGQTDSQENQKMLKKMELMPQSTNQSEKVFKLECLKKESSSESTTIRRNTVFSQDDAKIGQRFIDFPDLTPKQLQKVKLIQNKIKAYLRTPNRHGLESSNNTDTNLDKLTPHIRKSSCGDFQAKVDAKLEIDESQNPRKQRSKSCHDWRQYFEQEELESAYDQIEKGEDPNEDENISVSDDCASEDNFEMDDLYKEIYMREGSMKKELQMRQKAEKQYLEEIKELVEENFSDDHDMSQEQNQTLEYNQTPIAIRKKNQLTNVLPLERSQIKEGTSGLNQTQNSLQVNNSFTLQGKDQSRQSQERRPRETMVKLLNVLASSSNRRKTFDPVLHQRSFNQGRQEQKSFIITNNATHQNNSDYHTIKQGDYKRPSSQFSVNGNGANQHVNSQQDTSMDIEVQSLDNHKSLERTPVYSKVTKLIANTPIKIYQQSENVSSLGNHKSLSINNTQSQVQNEFIKQRKQNFQQYLMKNLRYEDTRIQNVYTQISHTNKITNPIHSNPSTVKKSSNMEFQRLKSRNTQKREDPYRGQIQQFQLIKPHNKLAPQPNIQLPSIAHQNFQPIPNQGRMQQPRKAKSKGMRPLALHGHNAFGNQQNKNQFSSNIMSNRSFVNQ